MKTLLTLALVLFVATTMYAERQNIELVSDWRFIRQEVAIDAPMDRWETVSVPHTWNAIDGANGKAADPGYPEGYYRGPAWYSRALNVPVEWKGKRVFIRFEAVSLVADVFVNNVHIGQHRGGFAAFCFELTSYLHFDGKDTLKVRADNSRAYDVPPLSGDFTVFGGIYRPVHIFATNEVCVSPLELASPGVFLSVKELTAQTASVEVKAFISNGAQSNRPAKVEVEIRDAAGATVAKGGKLEELAAGETRPVTQILQLDKPVLWKGKSAPYLYSTAVRVLQDGQTVDEVVQPLGIRTVAITQESGFLLNGEPYPIRGVNRHQDRAGKGWALTDKDHEEDHALIVEMGATAIRLAHYQQAEHFHNLNDQAGMIVWQEIPVVDTVSGSPQFLLNARQQLKEMIWQTYNHPSIAVWSLFNELDAPWSPVKTAPDVPIIRSLQELAKELDPSRPTVAASYPQDAGPHHKIADWMGWNIYPGWYSAKPEDARSWIDKYSGQMGKRIALSEYGAGANPLQFQEGNLQIPKQDGPFHPQEWQNYVHERLWAQIKGNSNLWGTFIWAMFDFAVDKRNEGSTPGINDKGLVTRDRKIKKDTYYFYKANWNAEPMVYITSRRATPRHQSATEVKVYSNAEQVELRVNGKSVRSVRTDDIKVAQFTDVSLTPGENRIEAIGHFPGRPDVVDSCIWALTISPATSQPDASPSSVKESAHSRNGI